MNKFVYQLTTPKPGMRGRMKKVLFIFTLILVFLFNSSFDVHASGPSPQCNFSVSPFDKNGNRLVQPDNNTKLLYTPDRNVFGSLDLNFDLSEINSDYWAQFAQTVQLGVPDFFFNSLKVYLDPNNRFRSGLCIRKTDNTYRPNSIVKYHIDYTKFLFCGEHLLGQGLHTIHLTNQHDDLLCTGTFSVIPSQQE